MTRYTLWAPGSKRASEAAGLADSDSARGTRPAIVRCGSRKAVTVPGSESPASTAPATAAQRTERERCGRPSRSRAREAPEPDTGFPEFISPFAPDELAAALTLTVRAAEDHLELATDLATKLRMTAAALEAGAIDLDRARIIAAATRVLTDEHAAR